MTSESFQRKLTAILSADVVGYSRLMGEDEESTVRTLNKYKEMIFDLIERHKGRLVDSPGDNLLAEFKSVVDAVRCGVQIQEDLKVNNEALPPNRKMEFRIGINIGDVIQDGDRIYGDGVNVAARIESLADPGGICISRTAYDQVKKKLNYEYKYLGEFEVKNIDEPVRVYRVLMDSETSGKVIGEKKAPRMMSRKIAIAAIIILIIIAAGLLFWNIYSHKSRKIETASIEPEQPPAVSEVEEAPKTIAVLPFDNLSSDPEQVYFVDGLTEEILNSLTKIPDLLVTARTSSFAFKGTGKTVKEIAGVLGVDHILEGSVRKAGNALRITAQLIRTVDGFHLWSETYDRKLDDIFAVQEDIAMAVADELKVILGIDTSLKQLGGTDNVEAYEYYLVAKGQIALSWDTTMVSRALETIERAITLDPEFALAWDLKAQGHIQLSIFGPANLSADEENAALHAAQRSIELEPNLGSGYIKLGQLKWPSKRDWIEAETCFRKALELLNESFSGNDDYILAFYNTVGKFERAHELIDQLQQKDPLHTGYRGHYIMNLALLGNAQGAEEEYERCKATFGDIPWHGLSITWIRIGSGKVVSRDEIVYSDPVNIVAKEFLESPDEGLAGLRRLYINKENFTNQSLGLISIWAAYFGDPEFAMDVLEDGPIVFFCIWLPVMHEVRQLPRFKEFVREIGLVEYWNEFGWPDTNICRPLDNGDFVCD